MAKPSSLTPLRQSPDGRSPDPTHVDALARGAERHGLDKSEPVAVRLKKIYKVELTEHQRDTLVIALQCQLNNFGAWPSGLCELIAQFEDLPAAEATCPGAIHLIRGGTS